MKVIVEIEEPNIASSYTGRVAKCSDCKHFVQHYGKKSPLEARLCGYEYYTLNAGHCTFPRIKDRTPDTLACKNFEIKDE